MAFTLTSEDRIAMSRRLVKVSNEVEFFNGAKTNTTGDVATLTQTDNMNKVFMDFFNGVAASYEAEKRAMNGTVALTFDESDIIDSAKDLHTSLFFPLDPSGTPNNPNLIPGTLDTDSPPDGVSNVIIDEINGGTASTDSYYEQNLINFPPVGAVNSGDGIAQIIDILTTGFTPSSVASTTLSSSYIAGSGAMVVSSGANIANGDYVIAKGTGTGVAGLFLVKAGGGTTNLTVYEIVTPNVNIVVPVFPTPNNTIVTNSFSGFSNSDRNTGTTGSDLQNVLTGLTTTGASCMITKVLAWEAKVDDENSAIAGNEEDRSAQTTQLTSATTNNTVTKNVIDVWQALSNTGASGKFVDASLNTVDTHLTSRISTVATRLSQITTALGTVTDNTDGTVAYSDATAIYPKRYNSVNYRINRSIGSLKKKLSLGKNSNLLDSMVDVLSTSQADYSGRMLATKLSSNADGTAQIKVEDATGFALDDTIYIASETAPEITGTIRFINGKDIVLSFKVGVEYLLADLARMYKVL